MAARKIRDENYYQVNGWMLRLGIKGVELDVYAIIYGFSQDGESSFTGSLQYLSDFTNATRRTVINALNSLVEKGYLIKHESHVNGVKFNTYKANLQVVKILHQGGEIFSSGGENFSPGGSENFSPGGGEKTAPNNKSFDNKDFDNKEDTKTPPLYGEYKNVMLTDEDLEKLKAKFPKDWQDWIEKLSSYMAQSGKKYQSHLATICNWARRDEKKKKEAAPTGRTELENGWMKKYIQQRDDPPKTVEDDPKLRDRAERLRQSLTR